jgi:hypothetical protein
MSNTIEVLLQSIIKNKYKDNKKSKSAKRASPLAGEDAAGR